MTRSLFIAVAALVALAACGCAPAAKGGDESPKAALAAPASPGEPAGEGSMRLTIRLSPGGPEILSRVVSPEPANRRDPYARSETFYRAYDAAGRLLSERGFRLETERRAEAPAADGTLTGARAPVDAPIVTLQIPLSGAIAVVRLYRGERSPRSPGAEPELLAEVRP